VLIAAKPRPHFWSEIGKFGQLLRQLINLMKLIRPLASPKDHPAIIVADSLPAVDYLHEVGSELRREAGCVDIQNDGREPP